MLERTLRAIGVIGEGWRIGSAALAVVAACALARPAAAQVLEIAIDLRPDLDSGCTVDYAPFGPELTGVDLVIEIEVDPNEPIEVVGANLSVCDSTTHQLGAPFPQPGTPWSVGGGNGVGGADVVEALVPALYLGEARFARLAVRASDGAGSTDVLYSRTGLADGADVIVALDGPAPVPSASGWGFLGLVVVLLVVGAMLRRRELSSSLAGLALTVVVVLCGVALAAMLPPDGSVDDWLGLDPVGVDPANDASPPSSRAELVALFASSSTSGLHLRVDVGGLALPTATPTVTPTP